MSVKKIKLRGLVINGDIRYPLEAMDDIDLFLGLWDGKEIDVIYDASDSRSKNQNAFFHAVVIQVAMKILREHGHPRWSSQEYVKEVILKKPFLTVNVGEDDEYIRHTSDLTVVEMWRFINQCLVLIADLGGRLSPEEQSKYLAIVEKYKLESGIDDAIERDL